MEVTPAARVASFAAWLYRRSRNFRDV